MLACFACSSTSETGDAAAPDAMPDVTLPHDGAPPDVVDATVEVDAEAGCNFSEDPTFGTSGLAQFAYPPYPEYRALAIQPDGKIVVAGRESSSSIAVARFTTDGQADVTFGTNGVATVPATTYLADAIAVQPDGKIVIVAYAAYSTSGWFVMRLDTTGALDTTFGNSGYAPAPSGRIAPTGLAIAGDGSVFVGGYIVWGQTQDGYFDYDFFVAKLDATGQLVTSFGNAGMTTISFSPYVDEASTLVLQPDGKLLVAGHTQATPDAGTNDFDLAFARLDPVTGALDTTFGTGGRVVTNLDSGDDLPEGLAIDGAGNIVVAVSESYTGNDDFVLVRYTPSGALDTTFGTNGVTRTDIDGAGDYPVGVAILGDRLVVAGSATVPYDAGDVVHMALATYTLQGINVTAGLLPMPLVDTRDEIQGQRVAPDGTLVVAGYGQRLLDSTDYLDLARIECR